VNIVRLVDQILRQKTKQFGYIRRFTAWAAITVIPAWTTAATIFIGATLIFALVVRRRHLGGLRFAGFNLFAHQGGESAAWLRTVFDPFCVAFTVEGEGFAAWIVGAEKLDKLTVACLALVSGNDAVEWSFLFALA
jgi:hypothetical protein